MIMYPFFDQLQGPHTFQPEADKDNFLMFMRKCRICFLIGIMLCYTLKQAIIRRQCIAFTEKLNGL